MVKHFRNLLLFLAAQHTYLRMANLPQVLASGRMPRVHLVNPTPAVLRFQDGSRLLGNLQVISLSGGMLRLSQPLGPNTCASLMFLSDGGPVLGKAEMLSPLSHTQQAFRFVALDQKHRHNLQLWIQSFSSQSSDEERWISKYRSALNHRPVPRRPAWKIALASVAFGMLILSAAYFVHFRLLK
jgi:hypothetical protein